MDDRYRLLAKIGTGGMGDVFLAIQRGAVDFSRLVVLKRIHNRQVQYSEQVGKMFLNEASVVASLNHPHIVKAFDFCMTGSAVCIVMEYVEGETLKYIASMCNKRKQRIPVGVTCRLILDACDALHYAHNSTSPTGELRRVVHRDIGLHNMMLDSNGYLKIIDFGIAKSNVQSDMTVPGLIKGNPAYMAPDLFVHPDPDHRIDIYALGLCLFELLTQSRAFKFDANVTVGEIVQVITSKELSLPSEIAPDLPKGIDDVILKATDKDRTKRYQSIEAFAADLKRVVGGNLMSGGDIKEWFASKFSDRLQERRAFGAKMLELARRGDQDDGVLPDHMGNDLFNMNSITPGQSAKSANTPMVHTTQVVIERNNLYKLMGAILLFFALSVVAVTFVMSRDPAPASTEPAIDNVVIACEPEGAMLTVDDKELGRVGKEGLALHVEPNKPHKVVLSKAGYRDFELPFIGPSVGSKRIDAQLVEVEEPEDGLVREDRRPDDDEAEASTPNDIAENGDEAAMDLTTTRKKSRRFPRKKASNAKVSGDGKRALDDASPSPKKPTLQKETNRKIPLPDDDENKVKVPVLDDN